MHGARRAPKTATGRKNMQNCGRNARLAHKKNPGFPDVPYAPSSAPVYLPFETQPIDLLFGGVEACPTAPSTLAIPYLYQDTL